MAPTATRSRLVSNAGLVNGCVDLKRLSDMTDGELSRGPIVGNEMEPYWIAVS